MSNAAERVFTKTEKVIPTNQNAGKRSAKDQYVTSDGIVIRSVALGKEANERV